MASTRYWDFNGLIFLYGGVPIKDGFGEGGGIKAEKSGDDFGYTVGVDGSVTRWSTGDRTWLITIMAGHKSPINTILSTFRVFDINALNGAGAVPCAIQDPNGLDNFIGSQCWIVKPASMEFTKEPKDREWQIAAVEMVHFQGV